MSRRDFLRVSGAGVAGATFLSACTNLKAGFTGAEAVSPGTLLFSHGPETSGTLEGVIAKFNKENEKGITVEWRIAPADSTQYFDKLRTGFQAGNQDIDLISGDVTYVSQFAANGWVEDLSDLFTDQMQSLYLDTPLVANTYKDKKYGVPWFTDAGMLYYRKDLLTKHGVKAPPKTWDEVYSIAQKVQKAEGTPYGFVLEGAEYEGGVCNGLEYIWNAGGDVLAPNDISKVVIGTSGAQRGLNIERDLVARGLAPLSVAVFKEQEAHTAFLTNEESVFIRNWPYMYGLAADPTVSAVKPEAVAVARLPVASSGNESFGTLGGWNFLINKFSPKKEQAWEVIKYMSQPEIQKEFAIGASFLPTKKSLYQDEELTKKQPVIALAADVVNHTKPRPVHPFYSDMSLDLAEQFNENLKGEVNPKEAADTLQSDLQRIADTGARVYNLG